jgi:hypothetical protein
VIVRLLPILGQSVCERVTQPICLALPDLFQDRLAEFTEHAAHGDMVKQSDTALARGAAGR